MIQLPFSPDLTAAAVNTLLLRATALLGVAWIVQLALRRSAAATRHAVWNAALASLLALPIVSLVMPRWELPSAPVTAMNPSMPVVGAPAASAPVAFDAAPAEHEHGAMAGMPAASSGGRPATILLSILALWALGTAFGIGRLSSGWAAARRLVRRAHPLTSGRAEIAVRELSAMLGIRRSVRVLASDTLSVPVSCGLLSPVILLPQSAGSWSAERLRVVLLHELAHVRRWDYASLIAMEAARAIYWPNPLVWLAARRANVELERACDDEVLRAGTRSVEYAEHLYEIAASLAGTPSPSGALAMAQPSTLGTRVRAILAASMDRSPLRPRALAGAAAAALMIGVPLASLRLLGEGQELAAERRALSALASSDATTRAGAAWTLGRSKSANAVPDLVLRLRDSDAGVRGMAAWALGAIGEHEAGAPLAAALRDPDGDVREMAVLALGELGDRAAVEALAPLVRDPQMGVRGVLTHALEQLGGDRAGEVLAEIARRDPDQHAREMATWSLQLSGGAKAVLVLLELLRDPDPSMRATAARNLHELGDIRALDGLAMAARSDTVPRVRGGAAWALGALKDARAAEPLAAMGNDPVWEVRVAATAALGKTPGMVATQALIAATRDPVHQVRLTAVESLNQQPH